MRNLKEVKYLLKVLSKKNSFKIITECQNHPKTILDLSNTLKMPYMTVKNRVDEMVDVNILFASPHLNPKTNRINKSFVTKDFSLILNSWKISELLNNQST